MTLNDRSNGITFTGWANMQPFHSELPALTGSRLQITLKPGSAITDAPTNPFIESRCPAEFYGSNRLRIANIAKNELSDAHNLDFEKHFVSKYFV